MADKIAGDELDGILDGALDAFESAPKPKTTTTPSELTSDVSATTLQKSDAGSSNASEDVGTESELMDEAARAFDDAVKALGDLRTNPPEGSDGEDVNEADMKLVEEFMASLGSSLGGLGVPGAGGDGTRDASGVGGTRPEDVGAKAEGVAKNMEKMVENIVGHLLSEDVLKTPMQQMRAAYAEWLPKHAEELSAEEFGRYSKQQELVEQICDKYESGADSGVIIELLSKMQETGNPPADVMKGLSGEAENGEVGGLPGMAPPELDKMVESCGMQ